MWFFVALIAVYCLTVIYASMASVNGTDLLAMFNAPTIN